MSDTSPMIVQRKTLPLLKLDDGKEDWMRPSTQVLAAQRYKCHVKCAGFLKAEIMQSHDCAKCLIIYVKGWLKNAQLEKWQQFHIFVTI